MVQLLNKANATKQFMTCLKRQAEIAVLLEKCRLEDIASEVRKASQKLRAALDRGITTHVLCLEESTKRALSALKDARTLPHIIVEPVVEPRTAERGKGKKAETSELDKCYSCEVTRGDCANQGAEEDFEEAEEENADRGQGRVLVCDQEDQGEGEVLQGATTLRRYSWKNRKRNLEADGETRVQRSAERERAEEDSDRGSAEREQSGSANVCQPGEKRPAKRQKTTRTAEDNEMRGGLFAFPTSSSSASSSGAGVWSASCNASSPCPPPPPPPPPPVSSVQARLDRLLASFVAQNHLEGRLPLLCFSMLQSQNFLKPCSVAFDEEGSLLVADCLNNRVVPW